MFQKNACYAGVQNVRESFVFLLNMGICDVVVAVVVVIVIFYLLPCNCDEFN